MIAYYAHIIYNIVDYTEYTNEIARIDSVANITSQLTEKYDLIYGKDFKVGEIGVDERGYQWIKIYFADEKSAMMIKLQGINKIER